MAYNREEFALAEEVFQYFLKMAKEHKWRLSKTNRNIAEKGLTDSIHRIEMDSRSKATPLSLFASEQPLAAKTKKITGGKSSFPSPKQPQAAQENKAKAINPEKSVPEPKTAPEIESIVEPKIHFSFNQTAFLEAIQDRKPSDYEILKLTLEAYQYSFRTSYDPLICLPTLKNIQSLWYQEETARKVMKEFRGP
jgi:hypothetical protein